MQKRRNNSDRASTLQIALSTGLISISAILLAIAAPNITKKALRHDPHGSQLEEGADIDSIRALGNYPDTSILLSTDTAVTPDAAPTNTTSINVSTSTNFKGTIAGDPTTGVVRVTDAHPAGTYTVTVRAFDGSDPTTTFTLTVTTPVTCIPVSFAAATNFGTPLFPVWVTVGDFNGDGKQDLAVANYGVGLPHPQPGSVWILLGNGAGNFSVNLNPLFGHPELVAVGDFNNDGKQDLAVMDGSRVWILLGDGAGNFPAATFLSTGYPSSIAVGDFNGDGKQDFAETTYSNSVSILLGDGTGNFGAATNFGAGPNPGSVVVGDLNGDGNQDLAVANAQDPGTVSILLGDGAGNFSAPISFGAGNYATSVAVGDFNGDGKQDLAVANPSSSNVSILLGDGAGNLSAATTFAAGFRPGSVVVGDLNGDGNQDLAVANAQDPGTVSILLGDGVGNFSAPISFGAGNYATSVAVGDFNGDGKQDLAVANPSSSNVSILLRSCAPTPTPTPGSISGTVTYCPNPTLPAIPGVTMTLTGIPSGSTTTDGSGNYQFTGLTLGNNYTVTPSKAALTPGGPGSAAISTVDVIAIQRHFLQIGTPLSGCRLAAANCASPAGVNTVDVLATQKFFLQRAGTANVGNYSFNPVSRSYSPLTSNQTAQNYDTLVFGDVAAPFAVP